MIEVLKQALEALYDSVSDNSEWIAKRERAVASLRQAIAELESQEPVAWGVFEGNLHDMFFSQEEAQEMAELKGTHAEVRPLYATPQRTWVGLTDEEENEYNYLGPDMHWVIQEIEAKLKEKNNG
jgi:hypothetical protein